MIDRPLPLTPADSDLSDFGFMPLDVGRFRRSDLVTQSEPEAIVAAIMLWGAAWHSQPAASLSNDDRSLAQAAGYGRAVAAFQEIKAQALHGFVECSDGRLYHPVVAEKALEAWDAKLKRKWKAECARVRKHNERNPDSPEEQPTFEQYMQQRRSSHATAPNVTRDKPTLSQVTRPAVTRDTIATRSLDDFPDAPDEPEIIDKTDQSGPDKSISSMSHATKGNVTSDKGQGFRENAPRSPVKGQGQGQGQGDSIDYVNTPSKGDEVEKAEEPLPGARVDRVNHLANLAGINVTVPRKLSAAIDQLKEWEDCGIDIAAIVVPTIERVTRDNPSELVHSLRYFDAAVRKAHALASQGDKYKPAAPAKPKPHIGATDAPDERVARFRARFAYAIGEKRYGEKYAPEHVAIVITDERFLDLTFRSESECAIAKLGADEDTAANIARALELSVRFVVLKA